MDAKGRVPIPSKYHEELFKCADAKLVVTRDHMEKCLAIYPLNEWQNIVSMFDGFSPFDKKADILQRIIIEHADIVDLDSAKRILIPSFLRELIGLKKDVVLTGSRTRFRLWDKQYWKEVNLEDLNTVKNDEEWIKDFKGIKL